MVGCACCGGEPAIGALCRACAREVAPCDGLIPEHVHSKVKPSDAIGCAIDGFGAVHPIGRKTIVGRNREVDLVVLASVVSREHVELTQTATGWTLRDLGSRNGTFVNGVRATGVVPFGPRARIKLGEFALWIVSRIAEGSYGPPLLARTMTGGARTMIRYELVDRGLQMCVISGDDRTAGGAVMFRRPGAPSWTERRLAPLEFQLLRALCARAQAEAASPSEIRGCVPTKQLAHELPFQSKYANQENVRQIVLRLRSALAEIGADKLVAASPGRGYYLACPVTIAGPAPEIPARELSGREPDASG
jgi:hypothetical protein